MIMMILRRTVTIRPLFDHSHNGDGDHDDGDFDGHQDDGIDYYYHEENNYDDHPPISHPGGGYPLFDHCHGDDDGDDHDHVMMVRMILRTGRHNLRGFLAT